MKKNKKIKFGVITSSLLITALPSVILSSCSSNETTKIFVDLENLTYRSHSTFKLSNKNIEWGKEYTTNIYQEDSSKKESIRNLYIYSGSQFLYPGQDYSYKLNVSSDACQITVFNPRNNLYIGLETSAGQEQISFNPNYPVELYRDTGGQIVFNYFDKKAISLKCTYLDSTSKKTDEKFSKYFQVSDIPIQVDSENNCFTVDVLPVIEEAAYIRDCEWTISLAFDYETEDGTLHHCELDNVVVKSFGEDKPSNVLMSSSDAYWKLGTLNETHTYQMSLNIPNMPFGECVNVTMKDRGIQPPEKQNVDFIIVNSLCPVQQDGLGHFNFSVDVKCVLSDPKKPEPDQDVKQFFDFEVSYRKDYYSSPTTDIATFPNRTPGTYNTIELDFQNKSLYPYGESIKSYYDPTETDIYYEATCPKADWTSDVSVEIQSDEPKDTWPLEYKDFDVNYVGDVRTIRFHFIDKQISSELDVVQGFKFKIKVTAKESGELPETIKWIIDGKPSDVSNEFEYIRANAFGDDDEGDVDFLNISYNSSNNTCTLNGLSDKGQKELNKDTCKGKYNALVIKPKYVKDGITYSLTTIASKAFFYHDKGANGSGKALYKWSKDYSAGRPYLIFDKPESSEWQLTDIKDRAFEDQIQFTGKLIIPWSVKTIGDYAFKCCKSRTSLAEAPKDPSFNGLEFAGTEFISNPKEAGGGHFDFKSQLQSIGESTFEMVEQGKSSFRGNLILPDSLNSISKNALHHVGFDGFLHIPKSYNWVSVDYGWIHESTRLKGVTYQGWEDVDFSTMGESRIATNMFNGCSSFAGEFVYRQATGWICTNKLVIKAKYLRENCLQNTIIGELYIEPSCKQSWKNSCSNMANLYLVDFNITDKFSTNNFSKDMFKKAGTNTDIKKTHVVKLPSDDEVTDFTKCFNNSDSMNTPPWSFEVRK